jgi:MoaA/NifB/PqqE/SkfB family radical SAM enzyme
VSERFPTPPEPDEGVVCWNINTACNYRCSYCTQRFKDDRGRWSRDTPKFLQAFARLPGRWEIKLSGGEPFVHPTLIPIVEGLAGLGLRISVVTNFSASDAMLERFVVAAAGRVGTFSASLHLEYTGDVTRFADRARALGQALARAADPALPAPNVCVTTVATRAALSRLRELRALFAEREIDLKVQPEREDGVLVDYSPEETELLASFGGHNATGALLHDFFGRPCWAGRRFLIMDDRGEVYRCYPARRGVIVALRRCGSRIPDPARERRLGRLGNLLDPAFRLAESAEPCLFRHCYCTVPIARGMMAATNPGGAA